MPAETLGSAPTESTADDMAALRRAANNASANEHVGFDHITYFFMSRANLFLTPPFPPFKHKNTPIISQLLPDAHLRRRPSIVCMCTYVPAQ